MRDRKLFLRVLSFLMVLTMLFNCIAYGGQSASAQPGGVAGGSNPSGGYLWERSSQFFRISLFWFPKGGDNRDGSGVNWSVSEKRQIGKTFDLAVAGGINPYRRVSRHSGFTNALKYFENGYHTNMRENKDYFVGGRCVQAPSNAYKHNDGSTMTFPRPMHLGSGVEGTDVKTFFNQDSVLNDIAYTLKRLDGLLDVNISWEEAFKKDRNLATLDANKIKSGLFEEQDGSTTAGGYLLLVEPGAYTNSGNTYSAMTLRDGLYANEPIYRLAPSVINAISQSVILEPNMYFKDSLGLQYYAPQNLGSSKMKESLFEGARQGWGVGAFRFWSNVEQLPVINYFYDLATGEVLTDAIHRRANTARKQVVKGNKYIAPSKLDGYELVEGYITNKEVVKGNLDIKGGEGLNFYNMSGQVQIPAEAEAQIGTSDTSAIKEWGTSRKLVTLTTQNRDISGISEKEKHIKSLGDGSIEVNYGKGSGKLQGVFLYVKGMKDSYVTKLEIL